MVGYMWCTFHLTKDTATCADDDTNLCAYVTGTLGPDDEPRAKGALVVVWPGSFTQYNHQEVWVASGTNIGAWYPLGNEFGRPKVWEDTRPYSDKIASPVPRPGGTIPQHPDWNDVLQRGPVFLLTHDNVTAYRTGWRNGRRNLHQQIEKLAEEDSGAAE